MNHVLISTRRFERDARNLTKRRPQVRDDLEFALGLLAEDAFHPSLKTHKLKGALEGSFACSMTHDEMNELLPSGKQPRLRNRVNWAATYLKKGGLLESPRRARIRITDRGRSVLAKPGLDIIYIQAKRWESVSGDQKFRGSPALCRDSEPARVYSSQLQVAPARRRSTQPPSKPRSYSSAGTDSPSS